MTNSGLIVCLYLAIGVCFATAVRILCRGIYDEESNDIRSSFRQVLSLEVTPFVSLILCWPMAFLVFCFSIEK